MIAHWLHRFFLSDFNSVPESGPIEYIKRGRVSTEHNEFKHIGYKDCLLKMLSHSKNDQEFTHTFNMASAYSPELMPYTNYTFDFKGIIERIVLDYKDIYKQAMEDNLQSPAELPYFEGDFWPNVLEDNIRELEQVLLILITKFLDFLISFFFA